MINPASCAGLSHVSIDGVRSVFGRLRRAGAPPSDALLARISAVVDLLVDSGLSEEGAARLMIDRMISAGVFVPKVGPARWKDLLAWRSDLRNGTAWEDVIREHKEFAALIKAIPPQERIDRVLQDEMWDRRQTRPEHKGKAVNAAGTQTPL